MLTNFMVPGKASFIVGGQFGSEAKGAAAAWIGTQDNFDILTTNAAAQAGHTSIYKGEKRVVFHLPSAQFGNPSWWRTGYLNAGCALDLEVLAKELSEYGSQFREFYIHPNAAVITNECREAEGRADSAQTRIASTRKGVGEAIARKALRSGISAQMAMPVGKEGGTVLGGARLERLDLCRAMSQGKSVLVEVPQGIGLSLNGPFYPHCTSRDCTVMQAASDAQIHPSYVGPVMLVLRTFPIRVGNITMGNAEYTSGDRYPDQREISWADLGVPPEITTVTKRVRRVFTWSHRQVVDAFISARPTHVFLSHVDYLDPCGRMGPGQRHNDLNLGLQAYGMSILAAALEAGVPAPQVFYSTGPTTDDVHEWLP